jgi:hypothetical protein
MLWSFDYSGVFNRIVIVAVAITLSLCHDRDNPVTPGRSRRFPKVPKHQDMLERTSPNSRPPAYLPGRIFLVSFTAFLYISFP